MRLVTRLTRRVGEEFLIMGWAGLVLSLSQRGRLGVCDAAWGGLVRDPLQRVRSCNANAVRGHTFRAASTAELACAPWKVCPLGVLGSCGGSLQSAVHGNAGEF